MSFGCTIQRLNNCIHYSALILIRALFSPPITIWVWNGNRFREAWRVSPGPVMWLQDTASYLGARAGWSECQRCNPGSDTLVRYLGQVTSPLRSPIPLTYKQWDDSPCLVGLLLRREWNHDPEALSTGSSPLEALDKRQLWFVAGRCTARELERGSGIQMIHLTRGGYLEPTVVERAAPTVCVRVPGVSTGKVAAGTGPGCGQRSGTGVERVQAGLGGGKQGPKSVTVCSSSSCLHTERQGLLTFCALDALFPSP